MSRGTCRWGRVVIAVLAVTSAIGKPAGAAVVAQSIADLSNEAQRIVVGDVVSVEPFLADRGRFLIRSTVTVAVTDDIKGTGPARIALTVTGGTVDGITLYTSVTPAFVAGDHVLLFLRPDGTIAGAYQGAWLTDGVLAVPMEPGFQRYEPGEAEPLRDVLARIAAALPGAQIPVSVAPCRGPFTLRGEHAAAFVLSSCNWNTDPAPMGQPYTVNPNCSGGGCGTPATVRAAIERSAEVWSNAGAGFYYDEAATTTSQVFDFDGQNIIYFEQTDDLDTAALAVTQYWCGGTAMIEWDIAVNDFLHDFWDGVTGSCGGRYDLQSVVAHELGHGLGLTHTPISAATMFGFTGTCNLNPRTLHADDIAGINFIYGAATIPLPLLDDFPATTLDPGKWIGIDGAGCSDAGLDEPSPPNSLDLDGASDGGNKLVSAFLDLTGLAGLELRYAFERAGGGDAPDAGADLVIDYSSSSGFWTELNRHFGDGSAMTAYEAVSIPLPAGAYHAAFHVRFRVTSGAAGADDWFVDDLCIGTPADCGAPRPCPWDCQAAPDGTVGINDLLALLAQWGGAGSCDFDGGAAGIADLLALLAQWGPCG